MSQATHTQDYDVIIIGGGITGVGTARDCALRGLRVLLIEKCDIANGATGRNHGLLHSGARYAVTDSESAAECISENMILKKVARHCVDDTSGLFITLPEDDLDYQSRFVAACLKAGIDAQVIDPALARRLEPSVNPSIIGAVKVPDGSVDPFRLSFSNILDARQHGAKVLIYNEVIGFIREGTAIVGVRVLDKRLGCRSEYYAPVVVNAGGIWGHRMAQLAGVQIGMCPSKGALLVMAHRVNNMVLNRCRKPANADILVPGDTVSVIGTTATKIPFEDCDDMRVTPEEVNILISEGAKLAPCLNDTRILRAYAGVRPLVSDDSDPTGRTVSRGIVLLDHSIRDGLDGFITITGGKLMTYRLMSEYATDLVCKKLGVDKPCLTRCRPLPGSVSSSARETAEKLWEKPSTAQKAIASHLGDTASQVPLNDAYSQSLVCECEEVTVGEAKGALSSIRVKNLEDLRHRTRIGMGTCQGGLCVCRAASLVAKAENSTERAKEGLKGFLRERWKGMYPVAWGETLRESEYAQWVYTDVFGIGD